MNSSLSANDAYQKRVSAVPSTALGPVPSTQLDQLVTVCIKHTPGYISRRLKLVALLQSISYQHGQQLEVLVASEASNDTYLDDIIHSSSAKARRVLISGNAGLSAGRNALVNEVRTPFLALMDDDVALRDSRSLSTLLSALQFMPDAAIAGGCYIDADGAEAHGCFNLEFHPSEDGINIDSKVACSCCLSECRASFFEASVISHRVFLVSMTVVPGPGSVVHAKQLLDLNPDSCHRVSATQNFFMARTTILKQLQWDPRQQVMEHETFFYQL